MTVDTHNVADSTTTPAEPASPSAGQFSTDAETALRAAIHAGYLDVQRAKLDRVEAAAQFVTTASGAIGTVYTALLAVSFSVASTPPTPLPARGLAPAVFLALAFFFSVVNVAFVRRAGQRMRILPMATTWEEQQARLVTFMIWIDRGALRRAWALRLAVVCLGGAVALMPIPFLALSRGATVAFIVTVAAIVALYFAYEVWGMLVQRFNAPSTPGAPNRD